jgi:two-component system response regulator FixJ
MPHGTAIYLLDGDQSARRLLAAQLGERGFEVWPFETVERFLEVVDKLRPSCILLDIGIDGSRGLDLISHLRGRTGAWPIIALGAEPDVATAVKAMRAGAVDFLEKPPDGELLDRALRTAKASLREALEMAGDEEDALARLARLTPRERDVATALMSGLSNKQAAHLLGISVRTVEVHRSHVVAKLGVRNMAEAAVLLARLGFAEAPARSAGAEPDARGGSAKRRLDFAA